MTIQFFKPGRELDRFTGKLIQSSIGEFWASHRPYYWKTHPDQMLFIIYGFSQKIEWMSFPVKRPV